jgi:hypothetical protein
MLLLLRVLFYLQLLLGLVLGWFLFVSGPSNIHPVLDPHITLGVIIAILALWVMRPLPGVPNSGVRIAARFAPLLPLLLGFLFLAGVVLDTKTLILVHMLLGLLALGLVEAAAGQQRRALRSRA